MRRFLSITFVSALVLASCGVDTTGISAESTRGAAGNASGAVTVTEFADIQCPACRSAYDLLEKPLIDKYGTQVRFEFRHFPLQTIHPYALELAEASECAADQQKFWEYISLAYEKQPDLKKGSATEWAQALGLDMDLFGRCLSSHIKRDTVLEDYDLGIKLGVQGTPTFFVNSTRVEATIGALSAAIEAGLQGTAQKF